MPKVENNYYKLYCSDNIFFATSLSMWKIKGNWKRNSMKKKKLASRICILKSLFKKNFF